MGLFYRILERSEVARFVYTLVAFFPLLILSIIATTFGSMGGMLGLWHVFCPLLGMTCRLHGTPPDPALHSLWVANHFQWTDWPMLQLSAWPTRLAAVVKSARRADLKKLSLTRAPQDIAGESSLMGRVVLHWCRNLGAIFYTRGDKRSGSARAPGPRLPAGCAALTPPPPRRCAPRLRPTRGQSLCSPRARRKRTAPQ